MTPVGAERVLVVGLGSSGTAAAEALLDLGARVRAVDDRDTPELRARAAALGAGGAEVALGGGGAGILDWAELVVASPGVPPSHPLIAGAIQRGLGVWSEIELAWRIARVPLVAVTGTNGKTTTTTLLAGILRRAGRRAVAAGNIGLPLVEAVRSAETDVIVCEVSSFQLAFVEKFRPLVAVVLNVADDHYDWHSGYEDYVEAKARITLNQGAGDLLVVRAGDAGCMSIAGRSRARVAAFGPGSPEEVSAEAAASLGRAPAATAGVAGGEVVVAAGGRAAGFAKLADIRIQGVHNLENVCAASLAGWGLGADPEVVRRAVAAFEGLPHRTELVAEVGGVRYIDDSKATNPHATLRALAGLDRVVLIAGGRAKGLDLSVLREVAARLAGVVVMGEAAAELESVFSGLPMRRAAAVEEAAAAAASMAMPGDTVLLSPACSSLDQYSSYAERGERFVKAVRSL